MQYSMSDWDQLSPAAKMQRFQQANGESLRASPTSVLFFYETGACVENGGSPELCIFHFPPDPSTPEGEHKLCWRKLQFAKLKLARAVAEFDQVNTILANAVPADEEAELAKLKKLTAVVEQRKAAVAEAQSAFDNTDLQKQLAEVRRRREEDAARLSEWTRKRRSLRV